MITGRKPFEHTNPDAAVIQKVLSGIRPERPSVGFSDALWALLIQSWREQLESSDPPAERPEIINILKQLQDEERYWDPDNRLLAPPTPIKQQPSGESSISMKFAYVTHLVTTVASSIESSGFPDKVVGHTSLFSPRTL